MGVWWLLWFQYQFMVCLWILDILQGIHDDVIKWKHFPRYWPFVWGIHRSPVNSPHKGQWRGTLMFSLICVWINGWVNNGGAGDLRRYRAHYDVTVMCNACLAAVVFKTNLTILKSLRFAWTAAFLKQNPNHQIKGNCCIIWKVNILKTIYWSVRQWTSLIG